MCNLSTMELDLLWLLFIPSLAAFRSAESSAPVLPLLVPRLLHHGPLLLTILLWFVIVAGSENHGEIRVQGPA